MYIHCWSFTDEAFLGVSRLFVMATLCPTPWLSSLKHTKPAARRSVRGVVAYVLRWTARANYDHPRSGARRAACVIGVIGSRPADRTLTSGVAPPRPAARPLAVRVVAPIENVTSNSSSSSNPECSITVSPVSSQGHFPLCVSHDDAGTAHQRCGHKRLPTVTERCNGPRRRCPTFRT